MAKKLWGGRFTKQTDPLVEEFSKSIQYDHALAAFDIRGSLLHVQVLKKAGYLTASEAARLTKALGALLKDTAGGSYAWDPASEDIHTDIQNKLSRKVGSLALKVHTARSRNDQVALATKLYCKDALCGIRKDIAAFRSSLKSLAGRYTGVIIPGVTHMQHAQPVYLKDYLGAYGAMLGRDDRRLAAIEAAIEPVMGAGALAGTPIPAAKYGTMAPANPLDAVSDRDFVIEIIAALAIVATHLSRLAEDLIIWSTAEFGFVDIDEAYCTGSSLMPQKKNADSLELIRGYAGRIYGDLVSVLVMMKGLPLSYNRDMQLDKEPLFASLDIVSKEVRILAGLMATLTFDTAAIRARLKDESLYATDLVYYLVGLGIPFKNAHTLVGKLIRYSLESGIAIKDMPEDLLRKKLSPKVARAAVLKRLDPAFSVASKRSVRRGKR